MARPSIIWRNPSVSRRRRIWNQAKHTATSQLYIVVRSIPGEQGGWEGLPNLEVIEGGAFARANKGADQNAASRA